MKFGWLLALIQKIFSWKLDPEENFETPVALVTYSDKGLTGISHESQNFVLKHIMPSQFSKKSVQF